MFYQTFLTILDAEDQASTGLHSLEQGIIQPIRCSQRTLEPKANYLLSNLGMALHCW